ncbi:hypothetical protein C823_004964 [Eubacterium plexicaudatum ASF492]|nr:hypothetical protein C823_004964 [Eubacterium plexicaudatum ASF492]
MICCDRLWKTLIDKHMNKTELRNRIGISNDTLTKLGKASVRNYNAVQRILLGLCREMFLRLKTLWKGWNVCIMYKHDDILGNFKPVWSSKPPGTIEFE